MRFIAKPSESPLIYQCPHSQCSEEEFLENAIEIKFKYSIDTSSSVTDPTTSILPHVESALLTELADKMLSHCLSPEDTRNLFQVNVVPVGRKQLRRRRLQTVVDVDNDSGASGVCSLPEDELSTEGKDRYHEVSFANKYSKF